jgi:uncharacterized protein (TIGR02145 family)
LKVAASNATAYQWRKNGSDVSEGSNYTTATYTTAALTATATYSVIVSNGMDACSTTSDDAVVTVHALPTITLASGSTTQTITYGAAMTSIKYNTANATSATPSNLPPGVSGAWASNTYTVSGKPTSVGTYNYTVTTTNGNGCTNAKATGRITVTLPPPITYTNCTAPLITLGAIGFTSEATYKINNIIVSSPVTATYCNSRTYTSFDGGSSGSYAADCAKNYYDATYGNWFSWCAVKQYASQLCPSPWRVPTVEDHCQIVNGSANDCSQDFSNWLNNQYGYSNTGFVRAGSCSNGNTQGYYWSDTELTVDRGYDLYFTSGYTVPNETTAGKANGFALRCVQ